MLCNSRGLLPGREGSLPCVPVLCPSSPWAAGARQFLPTALPSHSSPHPGQSSVCDPQGRAGRSHHLPVWQISLKSKRYCMDAHAHASWMFQKNRCLTPSFFHSIPFSCWFSLTQECQSTFHMLGMQPELLTAHQNSSHFTPSTAILLGFFVCSYI